MKIELAPEIFSLCKWQCRVVSNRNVSTFIKELKLELPEGDEVPFRAGGYMQIEAPPHELSFRDFDIEPEYREEWDQLRPVALQVGRHRARRARLFDGQLSRSKRASCCSRSASCFRPIIAMTSRRAR